LDVRSKLVQDKIKIVEDVPSSDDLDQNAERKKSGERCEIQGEQVLKAI
jgi:hypothetical protein